MRINGYVANHKVDLDLDLDDEEMALLRGFLRQLDKTPGITINQGAGTIEAARDEN